MTKDDLISTINHHVPDKHTRERVLSAILDYAETETAALREELEKWDERFEAYQLANKIIIDELRDELERAKEKRDEYLKDLIFIRTEYEKLRNENERLRSGLSAEELEKFIAWLDSGLWSNEEHHPGGEIVKTPLWYNTPRYDLCKNPKTMEQLIAAFRGREGK